jgi:hypothetical protein
MRPSLTRVGSDATQGKSLGQKYFEQLVFIN